MTDPATVRVVVLYNVDTNEYTYSRVQDHETGPFNFDFEIDAQEFARWEAAWKAWDAVTDELRALYDTRAQQISRDRETARLRANAETARAAYDAHLKRLAEETPVTDPATIARIRREIYDIAQSFPPGGDSSHTFPMIQKLIDAYGADAVDEATAQAVAINNDPTGHPFEN